MAGEPPDTADYGPLTLTLEFFESQAEQRRPTTVEAFPGKMRDLVRLDGRPLKPRGRQGIVSARAARDHAAREVGEWKARLRTLREREGERALAALAGDVTRGKSRRKPKPSGKP